GVMESLLMGTPVIVSREIGCLDFIPSEIRKEMIIEISDLKHRAELAGALGKIAPIVMAEKDKKLGALSEWVRKLNEDGWSEIKNLLRL
ncbi:MAG: hypothetical protein PHW31_04780, partial [Candidatus Pacebacteria bacterium]|nr:hypothetical protein [Candidatus Paceibacterota bacterium]